MPSIKELKDEIKGLAFDLVNECMLYRHFHPEKDGKVNKVLSEIINSRKDLINRVNNPLKTGNPKELKSYYQSIRTDMNKMVSLVDKLSE